MLKHYRNILILAGGLTLVAAAAFAQGIGIGSGIMDLPQIWHANLPPGVTHFLLLDVAVGGGDKFTLNGGGRTLCNAC